MQIVPQELFMTIATGAFGPLWPRRGFYPAVGRGRREPRVLQPGGAFPLDEDGVKLEFYSLGGPSQEALQTTTFPADKGIAGAVLQNQKSEVINDVGQDPGFTARSIPSPGWSPEI